MPNTIATNTISNRQWAIDQSECETPISVATKNKEQQTVAANVEINEYIEVPNSNNLVDLQPPTVKADPESLYMIVAMVQNLLSEHAVTSIRSKLQLNNDLNNQTVTNLEQALKAIDQAKENLSQTQQELTDATKQLEDAKNALSDKTTDTIAAQNQLDLSTAYLETIQKMLRQDPNDPLTKEKYLLASAAATNDQQALNAAQVEESIALQIYDLAVDNGNSAVDAALAAQKQVLKATEDYLSIQQYGPLIAPKSEEIQSALMTLLLAMAAFSELLSDVEANKIRNSSKLNQEMQQSRLDEATRVAEAYQRAVDTARDKEQTRGRVLKILNTLVMAAGVALAPFSGGFSMAVAAVTVSMYIADTVKEAQGEETPSGKMMQWAQENVIAPMTEKIAESIMKTAARDNVSMSKELAQAFATVISMTTLMVAGMAATAGGAALMSGAAKTILPNQALSMLSKMEGLISQPTLKTVLNVSTAVGGIVSASVSAAMNIAVAKNGVTAHNAQGDLTEINALLKMLQSMVEQLIKQYCDSNICTQMAERTSDMISDLNSTTSTMIRRIPMPA